VTVLLHALADCGTDHRVVFNQQYAHGP
jgi:hypothetical protein